MEIKLIFVLKFMNISWIKIDISPHEYNKILLFCFLGCILIKAEIKSKEEAGQFSADDSEGHSSN